MIECKLFSVCPTRRSRELEKMREKQREKQRSSKEEEARERGERE